MTPTDFLGREIQPGDLLVYPIRRGSQMWLKKMTVTQVLPDQIKGNSPFGRLTSVKNFENAVVVPPKE